MIKTVRSEEMKLLLELIPSYYEHCRANPDTLLTRFYGVHRVKPLAGSKVVASTFASAAFEQLNYFAAHTLWHRLPSCYEQLALCNASFLMPTAMHDYCGVQ